MDRKYIKQLTVTGFQVFADPVTVPLGPLTLLYGPNSAGKSAILDAMLALADLCDLRVPTKPSSASDDYRVKSMLARHWRRQSVAPATPAETLRLSAIVRIGGEEWAKAGFASQGLVGIGPLEPKTAEFASCFSVLQPLASAVHVDVDVSIEYGLAERGALQLAPQVFAQEKCIEIGLGGSSILRFHAPSGLASINLDHPALLSWRPAADLKWMAQRFGHHFVLQGGWFELIPVLLQ